MTIGDFKEQFQEPAFDLLLGYLDGTYVDAAQAQAALDMADHFEVTARMAAGGGYVGRLINDRHRHPGGHFGTLYFSEHENKREANQIAHRIGQRVAQDPTYADAIGYLNKVVLRSFDSTSNKRTEALMGEISRGFRAAVAEVCLPPEPLSV